MTIRAHYAKIYESQKSGCGAAGSALPWGGRGRTFKSCHSDQRKVQALRDMASQTPRRLQYAGMAELADALDSGSSGGNFVEVQVLLPAPQKEGHRLVRCPSFLRFGWRVLEPCRLIAK